MSRCGRSPNPCGPAAGAHASPAAFASGARRRPNWLERGALRGELCSHSVHALARPGGVQSRAISYSNVRSRGRVADGHFGPGVDAPVVDAPVVGTAVSAAGTK